MAASHGKCRVLPMVSDGKHVSNPQSNSRELFTGTQARNSKRYETYTQAHPQRFYFLAVPHFTINHAWSPTSRPRKPAAQLTDSQVLQLQSRVLYLLPASPTDFVIFTDLRSQRWHTAGAGHLIALHTGCAVCASNCYGGGASKAGAGGVHGGAAGVCGAAHELGAAAFCRPLAESRSSHSRAIREAAPQA